MTWRYYSKPSLTFSSQKLSQVTNVRNLFQSHLLFVWRGEVLTTEIPRFWQSFPHQSSSTMFSWSLLSALTLAVSFKQCLAGDSRTNDGDRDWHWSHPSEQLHHCHSIERELRPRLSPEAAIILPGNASFDSFEVRASSPRIEPSFSAVVEVSTEEDVQHTVCTSNPCLKSRDTLLPDPSWLTMHLPSRSAMPTVAGRLSSS